MDVVKWIARGLRRSGPPRPSRLLAALPWALAAACAGAADVGVADAVAARFPAPAMAYSTPGLLPGRANYTNNAELAAFIRVLAARPQGPRLIAAGRSAAGEPIEALQYTRGAGRPVLLLVGQQHGDEPAGAEALLVFAHWLTTPAASTLLDRVDIVVLPRANPDGAAVKSRRSIDGIDINRDHLLLGSPEARAVAALARAYDPAVFVDLHEYTAIGDYARQIGALPRNDLLLQYATVANLPSELTRVAEAWFRQPLLLALQRENVAADWYHTQASFAGEPRLAMGGVQPDTARNVMGLRNAVSLLLETRGLGLGRQHLQRRVHSHVVALKAIVASAAEHATALLELQQRLDAQVAASACQGEMGVLSTQTPTRREMLMLDPTTGADKPVAVLWHSALELRPLIRRGRPCGYWLGADAGIAVGRLREMGVTVRRLPATMELQAERWREAFRIAEAPPAARGGFPEPGLPRLVQVATDAVRLQAPPGSWWVTMAQPLANVVAAALEPDTPGSWYANRVLPELASAMRVTTMPVLPVDP